MFNLKIHRVVGQSMCPTMDHNDYVLCALWPGYKLRKGSLVVVAHSKFNTIVKRVQCIDHLGRLKLSGDHDSSVSTDSMGWINKQDVVGRVIFCISA